MLDLQKQMKEKKRDHDLLEAVHIFDLWNNDLERFLIELEKYEAKEEKDRLAHTAAETKGKRGAGKGAKPKGKKKPDDDDDYDGGKKGGGAKKQTTLKMIAPPVKKPTVTQPVVKAKVAAVVEEIDESEMSLMQRIKLQKERQQ